MILRIEKFIGNKDSIKEDVNTFRTLFMFILALLSTIFGYGFVNFEKLSTYKIIVGSVVAVALVGLLVLFVKKYIKAKEALKDFE